MTSRQPDDNTQSVNDERAGKRAPDGGRERARRKILKTVAVGGGALASATTLPDKWTKPVLNSAILPAHAMLSVVAPPRITGIFQATGLQGITLNSPVNYDAPQFALLRALVPAAEANAVVTSGICGNMDGPPTQTFSLTVRLNDDGTADFAVGDLFNEGSPIFCAGFSTVDGTSIADTSVPIGVGFNNVECAIQLSAMVASETEVTGTWVLPDVDGGDFIVPGCSSGFRAPLGGSFPTAVDCTGLQIDPFGFQVG